MPLPTLQQLAMQSLLEDEALAVSALEDLPVALFPALFREALIQRRMAVLKAMVQAWPFPCLPLGALVPREDLEMLEVILEGLEMLLEQKVRPSRNKLQVIDLQEIPLDTWTLENSGMFRACSTMTLTDKPKANHHPGMIAEPPDSAMTLTDKPKANHHPGMTAEPPFRIVTDILISDVSWDDVLSHLLPFALRRRGRVQLCPTRLLLLPGSSSEIQSLLRGLHLESIQELAMDSFWDEEKMRDIAPYLVRMKNLRILSLSNMTIKTPRARIHACHKTARLLLKQKHVHQYYIDHTLFLYENLYKVFRTLKHLTTLSLSSCVMEEADLKSLTQCLRTNQLKHLRLQSLFMDNFSPETLRALLERVAGTLETLALEHCGITDAQLSAILPILSQCSWLSLFSIYGNPISLVALENLLSHTAKLSKLSLGLYPAPLESYNRPGLHLGEVNEGRLAQVWDSLRQILWDIEPAHKVQICTFACSCERCELYSLAPDGNWEFTLEHNFSMGLSFDYMCPFH